MSWTGPAGPQGWQTYDPQLVEAIKDELRLKLTNDVDEFKYGVIEISLSRYGQKVKVTISESGMLLTQTHLPDGSSLKAQCFNLSDPDFDPIKTICRYVDKASKLIVQYEGRVRMSGILLEDLL